MPFLFTDIDGTIVHKIATAYTVPITGEKTHIDQRAQSLLAELNKTLPVCIVSGRRRSAFDRITCPVPHSYAIIEHGGLILDGNDYDQEWVARLKDRTGIPGENHDGTIWAYEQAWHKKGYKTDSRGRWTSFRLFHEKPDDLSEKEKLLIEKAPKPKGITTLRNQAWLDIIAEGAGKEDAIKFLLQRHNSTIKESYAFGDDFNDKGMLAVIGHPLTLSSARPEIIDLVRNRGGYVSPLTDHEGTMDVLNYLMCHNE